jgi:hypothetical protein
LTSLGSVAFSPDGRTLACLLRNGISLVELASGQERCRIGLDQKFSHGMLRYSPDGRWLAGLERQSTICLWDTRRGRLVKSFAGHGENVASLAFARDSRRLISASMDTTLLVWDVAGVAARQPPPGQVSETALAAAWTDLGSKDAKAAYRAIQLLMDTPAQSLPLLRKQLQPAAPANDPQIDRWVTQLDSGRFTEREQAARELECQGESALAALRRFLAGNPSLEARRRAERVLERLEGPVTDPATLRQLRALEVVEAIGTSEARQLLARLARGAPEATLTQEAAASLRRLARQP